MTSISKFMTVAVTAATVFASASATPLADVDFSKIQTWIGDSEATMKAAAVITWNDGNGLDNMVVGFRFNAGDNPSADELIETLVASDIRFYKAPDEDKSLCFDNGGEGEIYSSEYYQYDHRGIPDEARTWKFKDFNGLTDTAVFGINFTDGEATDPDYLFYLPAADMVGLWLLDGQTGALADDALCVPAYFNVCGGKLYSAYNTNNVLTATIGTKITIDGKTTGATKKVKGLTWPDVEQAVKGRSMVNLNYGTQALSKTGTVETERLGDVLIQTRFQYIPKDEKKQKYCDYSSGTTFTVTAPEVPATGIKMDPVTLPLGQTDNLFYVSVIPENATYTGAITATLPKVDGKSVGYITVTGRAINIKTYTTPVESTIVTIKLKDYPSITYDWNVSLQLLNPLTNITVPVGEDGLIHIPAYMKSEYMMNATPSGVVFEPSNADIKTVNLVITEGPGSQDGETKLITNFYQKGDKSNDLTFNLAFEDVAALEKYSEDVAADPANILSCTAHYESTDGSGVRSNDFKVVIDPRDRTPLADQYQDGTFWLNEEWFGHANGSINYITPERELKYRVYESQNPDKVFGCTSQYGMIYGDRLYVMSKQNHDTGDRFRNGGGRVVIADARTLKRITSFDEIGTQDGTGTGVNGSNLRGDGRACVGVRPDKVYLGHHKGIRVLNIDLEKANSTDAETAASAFTLGKEITIEGADLDQGLYDGQIGDMICVGKYVYAVSQADGLLVIDTETDKIVNKLGQALMTRPATDGKPATYKYSVQGVLQAADGYVWFVENDSRNTSDVKTYFNKVDPKTATVVETLLLPEGAGSVNTGWGAWRSANFFGSHTKNVIYWGNVGSGYKDAILGSGTGYIFRWEIGTPLPDKPFFELGQRPGMNEQTFQHPYATMRYDDRTDEILMCTTHGASFNYRYEWIYFINGTTGEINDCLQLRKYFWFPAIPIFPDKYDPEFTELDGVSLSGNTLEINLYDHIDDKDNNIHAVNFSLATRVEPTAKPSKEAAQAPFSYTLQDGILTITPTPGVMTGNGTIPLIAESNGKTVSYDLPVALDVQSGIEGIGIIPSIGYRFGLLHVKGLADDQINVFDINGRHLADFKVTSDDMQRNMDLQPGIYIIKANNANITEKIIVR